jgi:hypothetical protein
MKKNIPYLLVYYLVFIMAYSVIKHFAGWNATTFAQLGGPASNFVGTSLAIMAEIMLSLLVGVLFIVVGGKAAVGKFIIWATATVIPVAAIAVIVSHFVIDFVNRKLAIQADVQLHQEIIDRLPKSIFTKKSGAKGDFTGYVTADNDSLGLIAADTGNLAKVYMYVDSAKLGNLNLDSCEACNNALQKRLSTYVIPMQSFSAEEIQHNLNYIINYQCYVADRNIYLAACRKEGRQFIIINHVYDRVRHLPCYEIGFQVDCKTPPAMRLDLF